MYPSLPRTFLSAASVRKDSQDVLGRTPNYPAAPEPLITGHRSQGTTRKDSHTGLSLLYQKDVGLEAFNEVLFIYMSIFL